METTEIDGMWIYTPRIHRDDRGLFLEAFRGEEVSSAVGHPLFTQQVNCSVSRKDVLRGVHFADVPPGQAKYVTCVSGAILDVGVDLRVSSPTFGRWRAVRLDDDTRRGVYLAEGLGHAFLALSEEAVVSYMCSTPYAPGREHGVDPLDPELGIDWPTETTPVLSQKDADAPGLSAAREAGLLPLYADCQAHYRAQPSVTTA